MKYRIIKDSTGFVVQKKYILSWVSCYESMGNKTPNTYATAIKILNKRLAEECEKKFQEKPEIIAEVSI